MNKKIQGLMNSGQNKLQQQWWTIISRMMFFLISRDIINTDTIKAIFIFGLCPNILIFVWFLELIILCRFFGTLFLPAFLSNQHGIWTPYPQSSREVCYDFSESSSIFFRDFLDHYTLECQKAVSAYL